MWTSKIFTLRFHSQVIQSRGNSLTVNVPGGPQKGISKVMSVTVRPNYRPDPPYTILTHLGCLYTISINKLAAAQPFIVHMLQWLRATSRTENYAACRFWVCHNISFVQ